MEQKPFVVAGFQYGVYEVKEGPHRGEMREFANLFVTQPMTGDQRDDFVFLGSKAAKFKCVSSDLLKPLLVGDKVNLFFDDDPKYPKVAFIKPIPAK